MGKTQIAKHVIEAHSAGLCLSRCSTVGKELFVDNTLLYVCGLVRPAEGGGDDEEHAVAEEDEDDDAARRATCSKSVGNKIGAAGAAALAAALRDLSCVRRR